MAEGLKVPEQAVKTRLPGQLTSSDQQDGALAAAQGVILSCSVDAETNTTESFN